MNDTLKLTDWIDKSHFLNLYPRGHKNYPARFTDGTYHMCVLLIGLHLEGKLNSFWLNEFTQGVDLRLKWGQQRGELFVRDKNIDTPMSRDQIQFMPYCLNLIGRNELAQKLINRYGHEAIFLERWVPHWWIHYKRSFQKEKPHFIRKFCDRFEYLDMYFDKPNKKGEISESSIHKNIVRFCIMKNRYPSSVTDDLIRYFNKYFDAWEIMKEYHTRYWGDQPPIHLIYEPIIKKVFHVSK